MYQRGKPCANGDDSPSHCRCYQLPPRPPPKEMPPPPNPPLGRVLNAQCDDRDADGRDGFSDTNVVSLTKEPENVGDVHRVSVDS